MHFCLLHKNKGCILVFFDILQQLCNEKGIAVSALLDEIGMSRGNMARWKAGLEPKAATKKKISDVLGVSISELEEKEKPTAEKAVSDEELKFALFGDATVSDEDFEDVKRFAEFIKNKKKE